MLRNNLYKVLESNTTGETINSRISFDRSHPIFDGHFPGQPVVPGVCMMQILRELMEDHSGQKLRITYGDNLKFLAVINPDENKEVDVALTYKVADDAYNVTGSILTSSTTFFKFKGTFKKA
jgi:3-hydroxyacyl-[acyl-carrier-protein] dehydratase